MKRFMFKDGEIVLRPLEPLDIDDLLRWENDVEVWKISQTRAPYSKELITQYILSSQDIHFHGQIRFIIEWKGTSVGTIELFEYDPVNSRAGVGIMIDGNYRNRGFGALALGLIVNYCKEVLFLRQIFCTIILDNSISVQLFESAGFLKTGIKKDWIRVAEGFQSAGFFQLILERDQ